MTHEPGPLTVPEWSPTDNEAYCWLKSRLPAGYEVSATPQAGYFSEWKYDYRVTRDGEVLAHWAGDHRDLQPGSLAREVQAFMSSLGSV